MLFGHKGHGKLTFNNMQPLEEWNICFGDFLYVVIINGWTQLPFNI